MRDPLTDTVDIMFTHAKSTRIINVERVEAGELEIAPLTEHKEPDGATVLKAGLKGCLNKVTVTIDCLRLASMGKAAFLRFWEQFYDGATTQEADK